MPVIYNAEDFSNEVMYSISYVEHKDKCNIRWKNSRTKRFDSTDVPTRLVIDTIHRYKENMFIDEMDRAVYIESVKLGPIQGILRIPMAVMRKIYSEYRPELIPKKNYISLVW